LFNRNIVTFHADLLGRSAKSRAERAEKHIQERLNQPGKYHITTVEDPIGTIFKIDDDAVFIISKEDQTASQLLSTDDVVQTATTTLNQVVVEYQQSHNVEFITRALIKTGFALACFITLIWIFRRFKHAAQQWLLNYTQSRKLSLGGAEEHLRKSIVWIVKYSVLILYWLFILLASYECLSFTLEQFPHSRAWGEQLHGYLVSLATKIGMSILWAIPDLFTAFVIFMIARFITQALSKLFDSIALGQTKVNWIDHDIANTTKRIINVVIWLFAFVMAYPYLPGSGTEAFKGISVLLGLMLSLGASSLVSQAGSGLILTYTRIFRRGEYVEIAEHEGTVVELGMFTTRIRNGMGIELALPNYYILNAVTKNYSRMVNGSGFMIDATVTIGYDTPWRQVEAMLIEAALRTTGVQIEPTPKVFQVALSDFYPEYRLVCQAMLTDAKQRAEVISTLHANIQDVFNEYDVQIMSPHYFSDPDTAKTVPINQWYKAPSKPPLK
jgi:small-conductance mechanosensitive channel